MTETELAPVSVVIPCYRCADTIDRALASVFTQTWRPAEVFLVDDNSDDGTLSRLYELERKYPENWIHIIALNSNGGPGTARNVGWEQATQKYIAFLDADDAWHPEKIRIQAGWMLENPEIALTGHRCVVASERPNSQSYAGEGIDKLFNKIKPGRLLLSNIYSTPTVMLRRDLSYRFVPAKHHAEDFLLWCDICLDGNPCFYIPRDLAFVFKSKYGANGLSGDLWKMEKGELDTYKRLMLSRRINGFQLVFLWALSLVKYVKRKVNTDLIKKGESV